MRTFAIEGNGESPEVFLDEKRMLFEISGNSTLKDTNWFYSNLLKWMIAFNSGESRTRTVNIRLQRMNDSSAKWLTHILRKLIYFMPEETIEINWYTTSGSRRLAERAKLLEEETGYRVNRLTQ
ncbi:MAG: SiaC family regulatory phosphoprotein [Bacteroidales bacterium]|nr:SiaC family regulatory phosphoprotein [Bacteroidales bacterium]